VDEAISNARRIVLVAPLRPIGRLRRCRVRLHLGEYRAVLWCVLQALARGSGASFKRRVPPLGQPPAPAYQVTITPRGLAALQGSQGRRNSGLAEHGSGDDPPKTSQIRWNDAARDGRAPSGAGAQPDPGGCCGARPSGQEAARAASGSEPGASRAQRPEASVTPTRLDRSCIGSGIEIACPFCFLASFKSEPASAVRIYFVRITGTPGLSIYGIHPESRIKPKGSPPGRVRGQVARVASGPIRSTVMVLVRIGRVIGTVLGRPALSQSCGKKSSHAANVGEAAS